MSRKSARKGIESLRKQIEIHKVKLKKAEEEGNIGLVNYYEKEMEHFEEAIKRLEHRIMPKKQRKKQ